MGDYFRNARNDLFRDGELMDDTDQANAGNIHEISRVIPSKFLQPNEQSREREVRSTASSYNGSLSDQRQNPQANDPISLIKQNRFEREVRSQPITPLGMTTVRRAFIHNPAIDVPNYSTAGFGSSSFDNSVFEVDGTETHTGTSPYQDGAGNTYQMQQYYVSTNAALGKAYIFSTNPTSV